MLRKIKYRIRFLSKIRPYTDGVKRFLLLNLVLSIVAMGLSFMTPLFYKLFIDVVILAAKFSKMTVVITGYLGIFLINAIFEYLKNYANYTLVNTVLYKVKRKTLYGFLELPFLEYKKASIGDMKMLLEDDTSQISSFSGYQTLGYLIAYITLVVSTVLLFVIDWRLAIFSIISIRLTFWLDYTIRKKECVLNDSNRENDQKMSSWLHASVQGWREVKALNLERT